MRIQNIGSSTLPVFPDSFWNIKTDGICHCPYSEIQYMIGVSDNLKAINVKTGLYLRCNGQRLNKIGKLLKGSSKRK